MQITNSHPTPDTRHLIMTEYARLVESLSHYQSQKWINHYFDLVKKLLIDCSIERNDPRIAMTLPKDGKLPVNFGQRYVLNPHRSHRIEIIVPADFEVRAVGGRIVFEFTTNRMIDARLIAIPFEQQTILSPVLYDSCLVACMDILKRTKVSGFHPKHIDLLYDFTMEPAVRQEVLNEINWE